jgi:hypothetical protein
MVAVQNVYSLHDLWEAWALKRAAAHRMPPSADQMRAVAMRKTM